MDIDSEELFTKKCYKCDQLVLDSLKIAYNNDSDSKILLWNKFQIFVYENFDFESPDKIFIPEFQIHIINVSNNYLVCVDFNGNVHITSLKFKNSTQKRLKITFQPREQGIKTCIRYREDHILSLKYDADTYFLCLHRIGSDFILERKIVLLSNEDPWPLEENSKEKYLLISHPTDKDNLEQLKNIFKSDESKINTQDLVVLSVDKLTVYGFLFPPTIIEDEIMLVKLYSCPGEICDMKIIKTEELYLHIGLTMGTVIRLSLNYATRTPEVVHLNTALYKMIALKDSLIYSDGVTMWRAESIFSDNTKFTQFFVRNTNDFVKCGDQIICTTFSKLIYSFSIEDESAYLLPETSDEYCSAEKVLNNSEYLDKLFREIEKNNELVKKLGIERDYVTALALSKRQDVVAEAIQTNVTVFESFNEINNTEIMLTEEMKEYFDAETLHLKVTITNTNMYNTLSNVLSHLIDSVRIYVTLSTSHRILKTTCIKMEEPLKTVNYLVPIIVKNVPTEINVNIQIVVNIPGALDNKKTWAVLYRKDIILTSEHFIKTVNKMSLNCLKKPKESVEELIQKMNTNQYGNMFKFTDVLNLEESQREWSLYVKLPNDYEQNFKSDNYCRKYLSLTKTASIIQQCSADEFLKSKSQIIFVISNEKLKIKILNDGFSNPLLKITGVNAKMVFNIRNFFANMIYNDYENYEPGKEFISYTLYTTTDNLQKAVKNCILNSPTMEEILPIMDQFEKNVIGSLPL